MAALEDRTSSAAAPAASWEVGSTSRRLEERRRGLWWAGCSCSESTTLVAGLLSRLLCLGLRDGDGGIEACGKARLDGPQQAGAGGGQRQGKQRGCRAFE